MTLKVGLLITSDNIKGWMNNGASSNPYRNLAKIAYNKAVEEYKTLPKLQELIGNLTSVERSELFSSLLSDYCMVCGKYLRSECKCIK